jgi:hypothetical protein
VHAYYYDFLRKRGARADRVQSIRKDAETMQDWPEELERSVMTAQLQEVQAAYGPCFATARPPSWLRTWLRRVRSRTPPSS